MPERALRPCPHPGCDQLITRACPRHPAPNRADKGYGGDWAAISAAYLARHPRCFRCGGPAVDVHHVIPRRAGGSNHPGNLRAVCRTCHARITATTRIR